MIATIETGSPKVIGVKLSGKLHDEDYKRFVPMIESILTAEGKVRLFVQFEEFQGWDMHAAWDDFKFGLQALLGFRADCDGRRPPMGKVDGERVQALYQGQGEVFRPLGSRCCLDVAERRKGQSGHGTKGSEIRFARR